MKHIMIKRAVLFVAVSIVFAYFSLLFAAEKKFKEKSSTHFLVYYKQDVETNFVDDIIKSAEDYYEEIVVNLGFQRYNKFWLWDDRATIYIFGDKESYVQETKQPDWTGGCADYRNKKLWTYPHAVGFFDSVLPHELGHIIFREFAGFDRNIPLWFDEGVASYQEKTKRYAAKTMVKELIAQSKLLSFEELNSVSSPHDLDQAKAEAFYAQSVSIVYFLIDKFNKDRFVTLCRRLKEQKNFDSALDTTYYHFKNSSDLYKQWLQSIKDER